MYLVKGADQNQYGPVDAATIRQWLQEGRLTGTSQIRPATTEAWTSVSALPEFSGAMTAPPAAYAAGTPAAAAVAAPRKTSALAITSLVLGILTPCTAGVSGLFGIILGVVALFKIRRRPTELGGQGLAIAGLSLSAGLLFLVMPLMLAVAIPNFVKARATAQKNMCINQLRMIDGAKEMWALENKKRTSDTPTWEDLMGTNQYLPRKLTCPAGGTYTIGDMATEPACSVEGHNLKSSYQYRGRR